MSEPRRSTRARAREDAAPAAPETPIKKPVKGAKASLKRKLSSIAVQDTTPSTPITDGVPFPPKQTLPLRLADGAPLPTLPEPQPLDLPASEWQTIQQSGVLETSFERSKAVWLAGTNFRTFHTYFHQPKKLADRTDEDKAKTARQKEVLKNFPAVGSDRVAVKLVIEPHTLPIRLYGPKEMVKTVQKKASTALPYGPWPNHNHSQPNQHTKYQGGPPVQQKAQPRPQPQKAAQPAPSPAAPATPAPDPVIHMLAARAGTDPELKAVMKIVAAGQASKEQLEFFQTHINELTAILARQKEEQKKLPPPPPPPKAIPPPPAPKAIALPPLPRPVQPSQQQQIHPHASKPYNQTPPQGQVQQAPPVPQYQPYNNYSKPPQYHPQSTYNPAPPRATTYRPLVFSFVQGAEDKWDKFYFPSYSFMEWLPNGTGAKLSFLITKMKPKPEPTVISPSTPAVKPMQMPTPGGLPNATPNGPLSSMTPTPNPTNSTLTLIQPAAPTPPMPYIPPKPPQRIEPQRIEDFDEMNEIANIEFYQPVTVLLLIENDDGDEIASALPRSIRPPHIVEKYMNEVFDRCKRADETYLAFRLPKDGDDPPEKRVRSGEGTPAAAPPTPDIVMGGMSSFGVVEKKKAGRPRKSLV
jgi:hypothetical protein